MQDYLYRGVPINYNMGMETFLFNMFLTNGMKATINKYNRKGTGVYDDEYTETEKIVLCPYNQDVVIRFWYIFTARSKRLFYIKRATDIKEGDQISLLIMKHTHNRCKR